MAQSVEEDIKQTKHTMTTLSLTRHGLTGELNDFVRTRTELECVVEDLKAANERTGGKKEELEVELAHVQEEIEEKEQSLAELTPEWDEHRAGENEEKHRCVDMSASCTTSLNMV